MPQPANSIPAQKDNLHPRNLHRGRYDFKLLVKSSPELKKFVALNPYGDESVDFSNPDAVIALNKALLTQYYGVTGWDIPQGYLCPPIPGRADYIHYVADLMAENNNGVVPVGKKINILDIGAGANCIYPLIGSSSYGWRFVGTEIDPLAIRSAKNTIAANKQLQDKILMRQQTNKHNIFKGIIIQDEGFDVTICNPPFHSSLQEAQAAAANKWNKLSISKLTDDALNFGGQKKELWYHGGEAAFINLMIEQSALVNKQCLWFTTLVSKKETLPKIYKTLKKVKAAEVKTINMAQGQKTSRLIAWTFLNEAEKAEWRELWWG